MIGLLKNRWSSLPAIGRGSNATREYVDWISKGWSPTELRFAGKCTSLSSRRAQIDPEDPERNGQRNDEFNDTFLFCTSHKEFKILVLILSRN